MATQQQAKPFNFTIVNSTTGAVVSAGTTLHLEGLVPEGCIAIRGITAKLDEYYKGGVFKAYPAKPAEYSQFDYVAEQWFDPRAVPELRVAKWGEIKDHRNLLERSGFPYVGTIMDSDSVSVQRINTAVQAAQAAMAAGQPFSIDWTAKDNTVHTLDGPGMVGMPVALAQYGDQLHQTGTALRQAIDAATTPEAIAAITWPQSVG